MAIYRFVSNSIGTYVREAGDLSFSDLALKLTNMPATWPEITVVPPQAALKPEWIWQTNPVTTIGASIGQVRYFGRGISLSGIQPQAIAYNVPIFLSILADDAFRAKLRVESYMQSELKNTNIYDISNGNANTGGGLSGGGPPYKWQCASKYSVESPIIAGTTEIRLNLEIEVVNYPQENGTPQSNPAGLQYLLEVANIPTAAVPAVTDKVPVPLF